jgi:pilus assembly protein CpaE
MKIVVLSPSKKHLQDIASALQATGHEVVCQEGGKSHLVAVAGREHPDLLITDGMCCDVSELAGVEAVTTRHPGTAVVLMCSTHSPDYLLNAMRCGVREVLPSPVSADALHAAVQRVAAKLSGAAAHRSGEVLAMLPCKGGSGATFLAANLAWALSQDATVLLVDLNLQFGDALSLLHDGRPQATVADVAACIDRLDASLLAASTVKVLPRLSVLAAPDDPGQALEIQPEHIDGILATASAHYDFVLLDLGRSMDTLAIHALDRSTRVFAVLQPLLPAVRHASQLHQVFSSLGYAADKTQWVVNRHDRNAEIGLDRIQRTLHAQSLLTLADGGKEVSASIDHGEPLVATSRSHPLARQIAELAATLHPHKDEGASLLGRLFRRA